MSYDSGAKQLIAFSRKMFDSTAGVVSTMQDNTEKICSEFMKRMPGVPDEGIMTYNESVNLFRDIRSSLIKLTDEGFDSLEKMYRKTA